MAGFLQKDLGRGSVDLLPVTATIRYTSLTRGHSANATYANLATNQSPHVGAMWGADDQDTTGLLEQVLLYNVHTLLPKKGTIYGADLLLYVHGSQKGGGRPWPASSAWAVHEMFSDDVTSAVTAASPNGASATWYPAGGAGPQPGFDYDATPLDSFTLTSAEIAALTAQYFTLDVSAAVENAMLENRALRLFLPSPLAVITPLLGQGYAGLRLNNPANTSGSSHTYLRVYYAPPDAFYGAAASAGRRVDRTNLKNPDSPARSDRLIFVTPDANSTSDFTKDYVVNTSKLGAHKRVVVSCGRADVGSVNNSGSVSGKTLRSARAFDNNGTASVAATEKSVSGTARVITKPADTSKYQVYFTPDSTGAEQGPLKIAGSSATDSAFASDADWEITIGGTTTKHLTILSEAWSGTTANVLDVWRFTVRGDLRDDGDDSGSLGLLELAPPESGDPDSPDDTVVREAARAFVVESWAAPIDRTISSNTKTHLRLRDTWFLQAGDTFTLSDKDGGNKIDVTAGTVYASDDATYPYEVRLTTQITLANYDSQSYLCSGIAIGTLAASQFTLLSNDTDAGAGSLVIDTAFTAVPDEVLILGRDGLAEIVTVNSQVGNTINLPLGQGTVNDYTRGAIVQAIEADSSAPFFIRAQVPAGTALSKYLGWFRVFEMSIQ